MQKNVESTVHWMMFIFKVAYSLLMVLRSISFCESQSVNVHTDFDHLAIAHVSLYKQSTPFEVHQGPGTQHENQGDL